MRRIIVLLSVVAVMSTGLVSPAASTVAAADMGLFVDGVAGDIDGYWRRVAGGNGWLTNYRTPSRNWTRKGAAVQSGCGRVVVSGPFYCPKDTTIYLDADYLGRYWALNKDFAVVAILAHEWGHHIQELLGINRLGLYTIQQELQADCFAGAFARYSKTQGWLENGDLSEGVLAAILAADEVGTSPIAPGAHGSAEMRKTWFLRGYNYADQPRVCTTW